MNQMIETLSSEELARVDQVIMEYRGRQGSLISTLKENQDICGFLPKQARRSTAEELSLSPSQVYGIVSSYAFFTVVPRGTHINKVCPATNCCVKGSKQTPDKLEQELNLNVGGRMI